MNKKFLKELEALAKRHGLEVVNECVYCGHDEHEGTEMVSFVPKAMGGPDERP
jgi:Zn ribbon nucleic-acid-binding protein